MIPSDDIILQGHNLVKRFGSILAVNNVTFSLRRGEIVALLGENGAGKTTCIKLLNGYLKPDSGKIFYNGEEVRFRSPKDALKLGIFTVYQNFTLIDKFTVLENLSLAFTTFSRGDFKRIFEKYGVNLDLDTKVGLLTSGQKQKLEIIKALESGAKVLLLDEPTSVLAQQERETFFKELSNLSQQKGISMMVTTHKLEDAVRYSHRIIVLRNGKLIMDKLNQDLTINELTLAMFGEEIKKRKLMENFQPLNKESNLLLKVQDLFVPGDLAEYIVKGVSFEIYKAEVLGIIGIAGNGQVELADAIVGIRKPSSGRIIPYGRLRDSKGEINKSRLGYISDDPLRNCLSKEMSVRDNLLISTIDKYSRRFIINWKEAFQNINLLIKDFQIKCGSPFSPLMELSGGNIQKVVVARETTRDIDLLVAVHPARGLDERTSYFVYDEIKKLSRKGIGVLFISEDIDEVLYVSDRIGVMYEGKLSEVKPKNNVSKYSLGSLMVGGKLS